MYVAIEYYHNTYDRKGHEERKKPPDAHSPHDAEGLLFDKGGTWEGSEASQISTR